MEAEIEKWLLACLLHDDDTQLYQTHYMEDPKITSYIEAKAKTTTFMNWLMVNLDNLDHWEYCPCHKSVWH